MDAKELANLIDEKLEEYNEAAIETAKDKAGEVAEGEATEKVKEIKGELDALLEKHAERMESLETDVDKMKAKGTGSNGKPVSEFSKAIRENKDSIKALEDKAMGKRASFDLPGGLLQKGTMTTDNLDTDERVIPFDRVTSTPVFEPESRPLRDYINVATTSGGNVEWPIESVHTDNMGAVDSANAEQKPESEFEWDLENRPVRDIAGTVRLHKNLMNDWPLLESYLPSRLRDEFLKEESNQILNGLDNQQELIGITNSGEHAAFDVSGFQAAVAENNKTVGAANYIDILGYAMTQLQAGNYSPNQILVNPIDFYSFMFAVNDNGSYLMNNPVYTYVASLINQSNYVSQGEFLVYDGNRATTLFQRESMSIDFSYEDRDNFVKNLVTIRAEGREVLVTERPNAIIYGDFAEATDETT